MITKKSEDAVSPVLGIMLLVVVTVVIAAVITTFATGVMGNTEPVPVATLDVKIKSNVQVLQDDIHAGLTGPDFWITHISGDAVDTRDIEIRTTWTDQYGNYHQSSYSAAEFKKGHPNGVAGKPNGENVRKQPMYVKLNTVNGYSRDEFGSNSPNYYFGDAILTPGLKLTASADMLTLDANNMRSPFMDVIFDSSGKFLDDDTVGIMKYLPEGTAVNVMIVHMPSNKAIYDKEVIVE